MDDPGVYTVVLDFCMLAVLASWRMELHPWTNYRLLQAAYYLMAARLCGSKYYLCEVGDASSLSDLGLR